MTPKMMHRIDQFYDAYPTATPKAICKLMKSPYVHIQRLEPNANVGQAIKMLQHPYGRREGPVVEEPILELWLSEYFHPRIRIETLQGKHNQIEYYGHIELFKLPTRMLPKKFSRPKAPLYEIHRCCTAIVYDMLYYTSPGNQSIQRVLDKTSLETGATIARINDNVNDILSQKILAAHKSLPVLVMHTADYIKAKLDR